MYNIIIQLQRLIFQINAAAVVVRASSWRRYWRGGTKVQRDDTAMVAVYATPDIADKKPPAATPALQPAALSRLSRADIEETAAAAAV